MRARADAIAYLPVFLAGFLCRRHNLLAAYDALTRRRPRLVRLPPLALLLAEWLLAANGHTAHDLAAQYLLPQRGACAGGAACGLGYLLVHMVAHQLFSGLHLYAALGWLPPDPLPVLTAAGRRTLTGYLLSVHLKFLALVPASRLVALGSMPALWYTLVPLNLLVLLLLTSPLVHAVVAPITEPSWLHGWMLAPEVAHDKEAPAAAPPPEGGAWRAALRLGSFGLFSALCNLLNLLRPLMYPLE